MHDSDSESGPDVEQMVQNMTDTLEDLSDDEILIKLINIFEALSLNVSAEDIHHLFETSGDEYPYWDTRSEALNLRVFNEQISFYVAYSIDLSLSAINPIVQPGIYWWSAHGFPETSELSEGHGLFTFDGSYNS